MIKLKMPKGITPPPKDCNANRKFYLLSFFLSLCRPFLVDVQAMRKDAPANDESDVLLSFCWTRGKEREVMIKFPEFFCVDVTENTNAEKRGLFLS